MSVVETTMEIAAPVAEVFAYIDDFSNAQDWLHGLARIEPVGEVEHGIGAQYDGTMKVGISLSSRIECTDWKQDELIELTSIKGIRTAQRWEFEAIDDDHCRVHAHITYELPGGPAGKAAAKAVKPVVGIAVQQTTTNLIDRFEG